jgi:hypothetical protein
MDKVEIFSYFFMLLDPDFGSANPVEYGSIMDPPDLLDTILNLNLFLPDVPTLSPELESY